MKPTLYAGIVVTMGWIFVSNVYSQSANCGYMSTENVEEGYWPWMVEITNKGESGVNRHWCNGFLIDRRHVLSAAHCFASKYKLDDFKAHIGNKNWKEGEEYKITCITVHPRYDAVQVYDDIAILTLSRDVDTPNYTPICLPDDNLRTNRLYGVTVAKAAWGGDSRNLDSKTLMQVTGLRIISNKKCNKFLFQRIGNGSPSISGAVSSDMLCTMNPTDQFEPCKGSSGAPIMYKDQRNKWIAVGITVFGFACQNEPTVHIKVSDYLEWIMENSRDGKGECSLATGYKTEHHCIRECFVVPEECRGIPLC